MQSDGLGGLPQMRKREAEIRLAALLFEVQRLQRRAEPVRQAARDRDIDRRGPDHVARDLDVVARESERQREGRKAPEHDEVGHDRHRRVDDVDAFACRLLDEDPAVVGDALVGIVDLDPGAVSGAKPPIGVAVHPAVERDLGEALAPGDLEQLLEIASNEKERRARCGQQAEHADLLQDLRAVHLLERVEKGRAPGDEAHRDPDADEAEREHGAKIDEALPALGPRCAEPQKAEQAAQERDHAAVRPGGVDRADDGGSGRSRRKMASARLRSGSISRVSAWFGSRTATLSTPRSSSWNGVP